SGQHVELVVALWLARNQVERVWTGVISARLVELVGVEPVHELSDDHGDASVRSDPFVRLRAIPVDQLLRDQTKIEGRRGWADWKWIAGAFHRIAVDDLIERLQQKINASLSFIDSAVDDRRARYQPLVGECAQAIGHRANGVERNIFVGPYQ